MLLFEVSCFFWNPESWRRKGEGMEGWKSFLCLTSVPMLGTHVGNFLSLLAFVVRKREDALADVQEDSQDFLFSPPLPLEPLFLSLSDITGEGRHHQDHFS